MHQIEPFALLVARLIGVDAYSFEQKIHHIAQHVELPPAPKLGPDASALPPAQQIPPLLIINIQLPLYSVRSRESLSARHADLCHPAAAHCPGQLCLQEVLFPWSRPN